MVAASATRRLGLCHRLAAVRAAIPRKTVAAATVGASQTVTIGTAGSAGSAGTGGNGGNGGTPAWGRSALPMAVAAARARRPRRGRAVRRRDRQRSRGHNGGGQSGHAWLLAGAVWALGGGNGGASYFGGGGLGGAAATGGSVVGGAATNYGSGGGGAAGIKRGNGPGRRCRRCRVCYHNGVSLMAIRLPDLG